MEESKKYWISIFVKKCTTLHNSKEQLDFYFKWCANTYNVSEEKLTELKKKFTVDEYVNRLIPVIDKYFSIEEIKEVIKFYATDVGKKLLSHSCLQDMGKVGKELEAQIEQKFALNNNKS